MTYWSGQWRNRGGAPTAPGRSRYGGAKQPGQKYFTTNNHTSGYATMVHGHGCNPHRCSTTFANVEITSLWRHNSETMRDRQKTETTSPHEIVWAIQIMKTASLYDNFCKTGNYVIDDVIIWVQDGNCQKMARENFSIRALYNITKNQHNPIKTVGRDSFLSPKTPKNTSF